MNSYELCVWYSETRVINAQNPAQAKKMACSDGSRKHPDFGGVHAVEVIKINNTWTDVKTWRYSGQIGR
jgi:hypothetical protein